MSLIEQASRAIGDARELALACHIGPDGDALGSMLGLGIAAQAAGKKVVASFGSPYVVPGNLSFLPTELLVAPDEFPKTPETMVVLDAGSPDRLGELAVNAKAAATVVVIDHHVTNQGFGDIALVDPVAAATGELVAEILDTLGWPITPEIATCLHTAIVTDTGRFQYTNTRPETLTLAARLVAAGAEPDEISRHVYEEAPFGYLKAAGAALSRAELDEELSLVTTFITQSDLTSAGIDWGDIDNLINTIRLAQEADSAVIAKVHDDGRIKVSMRSRGATDVGALAAELGGGGHRLAAGFTYNGDVSGALNEIRTRIGRHR
jgi:phosphoesterase RecJ-like protein